MKKKFLRKTASQKESKEPLQGQVGRDHSSLILPVSAIKLSSNIRDKVMGIEELANSIKNNGLLNPLTVRKTNGSFEIIAGARRFMAIKSLEWKEVPVRIQNVDDNQVQVLKLIENLFRDELSGWETCKAINNLLPMFDNNQSRVAEAIGKSRSYVSKCITVVKATTNVEHIQHLRLYELFQLHSRKIVDVISERKSSGPLPGGRSSGQSVLQYKERRGGKAFSLRLNYDLEKTGKNDIERIVSKLEEILKKLKEGKIQ